MPSAVQVKTLVNSHYTGDDEQFNTVALQIAASEARQGELRSLLSLSYPNTRLSDMILSESLKTKLARILLDSLMSLMQSELSADFRTTLEKHAVS